MYTLRIHSKICLEKHLIFSELHAIFGAAKKRFFIVAVIPDFCLDEKNLNRRCYPKVEMLKN